LLTRALPWLLPALTGALVLAAWEILVRTAEIPPYVLPGPHAIAVALLGDWGSLFASLVVTLRITFLALAAAIVGGGGLAILFAQSRFLAASLYPYAIVLQVTPIVAISPLILIYVRDQTLALLICAWIVAFFPVLSNTTLGLRAADHGLVELMELYGAGRWRMLWHLRLPAAMPYFLAGVRIAGGLSLIGAVVAEFTAGTATAGSGLAYRILESGYRLDIPRMYAALVLLSLAGVAIYGALGLLSWLLLRRWHESERTHER